MPLIEFMSGLIKIFYAKLDEIKVIFVNMDPCGWLFCPHRIKKTLKNYESVVK